MGNNNRMATIQNRHDHYSELFSGPEDETMIPNPTIYFEALKDLKASSLPEHSRKLVAKTMLITFQLLQRVRANHLPSDVTNWIKGLRDAAQMSDVDFRTLLHIDEETQAVLDEGGFDFAPSAFIKHCAFRLREYIVSHNVQNVYMATSLDELHDSLQQSVYTSPPLAISQEGNLKMAAAQKYLKSQTASKVTTSE